MDPPHITPAEEWRDWAAQPPGILCAIFSRLPQAEILRGAGMGLVCSSWRRAAVDEPLLWRHIDLSHDTAWDAAARAAVDRSAGQCVSFRGRVHGGFLRHLADRAPSLRILHATCWWYDGSEGEPVAGVIRKLPLLERLVVSRGLFSKASLRALLDHCPRLELLDAGGCETPCPLGRRLVARCEARIKFLLLPRPAGCLCCLGDCQEIADAEDY